MLKSYFKRLIYLFLYAKYGLRSMSTLTVSISESEYTMMEKELSRVREKFLDAAQKCKNPDRVYQCNFSVFPVSKISQGGKI